MVLTEGPPAGRNGWEQLVYASALKQSLMLSIYHQFGSEPNESLLGYSFDTNSWNLIDIGGLFHTENMPEGGESQGYFDYNPNNNTVVYHCCLTGSNQPENAMHTWWYDVLGQSGRDKQTSPKPWFTALQPGGAFDVAHNTFVAHGGDSDVGTWTYDPNGNSWQAVTPSGTPPDPSLISPGMAYSSAAQRVYLFGGASGTGYNNDLYTYDVPTNSWTQISPAGGIKPLGRKYFGFAYDSTNNIFLVYGGQNGDAILGDTWVYSPAMNSWTQLTPPQSPPVIDPPVFAELAYDSDHNVFVLAQPGTGGYFGGSWNTYPLQTWLFRYQGVGPNAGTLVSSAQTAPGSINRNTTSWAKDPTVASSGDALYVAWSELGSPFDPTDAAFPHIYVSQYSAGNWVPIGTSFQSISTDFAEAHMPSAALIGSTPWVSWYQGSTSGQTPLVHSGSWNGSSWQGGPLGLISSNVGAFQGRSQLTSIAGVPYVALLEVNKNYYPQETFAYVEAWNGTSWDVIGSAALNRNTGAGTTADSISITNDGANPYVAWSEYAHSYGGAQGDTDTNPQIYVSTWNGTQWIALGGSLNVNPGNWAYDASIAYLAGQPYVAWTERSQAGTAELYAKTWNGVAWVLVGSGSLNQNPTTGWAFHPSLVADSGTKSLYLAWVEQLALGQKAQVYVSQLTGGFWTLMGSSLNVDQVNGSAQHVSLGVFGGQPVAAWGEVNTGRLRQIYVKQWNGSAWIQLVGVGGALDSAAPTTPQSLSASAISPNQINLVWSPSTDAVGVAGYWVYRGGSQIGNVTESFSYQDATAAPSTSYSYAIAAYDAAGNVSGLSSTASAITPPNTTTPPNVSITSPANGATLMGTVAVSANATSSVGIASVQFQLDGVNLGAAMTGAGPSYSVSWDTTTTTNGPHALSATAHDLLGNTATGSLVLTVVNPPVISGVSASSITSAGATITWSTNQASDSQVTFGITTAYGSTSALNSTLVTAHSVNLVGLAASTTYHYQVLSRNAQGNLATSSDFTFTTAAPLVGSPTLLQIQGNATEVSGVTNGSVVTPNVTPGGFTGTVVVNGTGSANFTPAQSGNGVYFLNCCSNSGNAYYKFTGTTIGNIFNLSQGQVTFNLQSRYSFAQRQASAATARYAFDVRDGNGNHLFDFLTQVTSGSLVFTYLAAGAGTYYFVPQGTENTLFGNGVTMQVTLSWNGTTSNLYLNGTLVKSVSYTTPTPSWTAASNFDLGAYQYLSSGYDVSDDVIDGFTVTGPAIVPDTTPPVVSLTAPASGTTVSGTVTVTANATDNVGVTGVQFQLDGTNLGSVVTGAGPTYRYSWNSTATTNGSHTLTAVASDAAGNTATSSVSITVNNDTTPPVVSLTAPASGATVSGTVTVTANATDNVGVTGVQFKLDETNLGSVVTGAGPTYSYSLSTTTVANGTHTLTATASDAAGNTASSSVSITVNNVAVPPVISGVAAGAVTSSGATITWTTDQASNSQVAYGTTSSYGSLSALNATLATSHSVTLTGLAASTTYHYQVLSQNAQGTLASSADYTFTTPAGLQTLLQIQGNATEVSGVTNGSVVTPNVTPGGFTGTVVDNGGSVNFTQSGNGVYFLNCCSNSGNAYYKFTGTTIGNIFNLSQGQVTFNLQSRYSFAQRQASAAASRYALDVRDGNGTHLFDFITQVTSGRLVFTYAAAGAGTYYFVPQGTEDTLFGNGVTMPVTLSWNGTTSNLYLNGTLVKSVSYTTPTASWTVASNFDLGAYEYLTYGGYSVSDDVIGGFTVTGPAIVPDTTPPVVSLTAPTSGATVSGTVTVTANATDNVGVTGVQFTLDGTNLGSVVTGAGPGYSYSWNSITVANGTHTLTATASDAAGNTASSSVSITVNNMAVPPVITGVAAGTATTSGTTITWTTDQASNSQVAYGTTSSYGSLSALNATLATSHSVTLTGLAASTTYHYQVLSQNAQGTLASSADYTFTTAQGGLQPSGVLIVYKANGPDNNHNGVSDSLELAQYYALKRNVPLANLLGLNVSVGSAYSTGQYGTFYTEMVAPIQNALTSLGSTNINVILLAGELPTVVYDGSNTALSVDSALMGINGLGSAPNSVIPKRVNPYFDPAPGFDASPGHFNQNLYRYNGTTMYLVTRLGSDSSLRGIDQVDQSLYASVYLYPQAGYYSGNAYVNSLYGTYTDAFLSEQPAVQQGLYDNDADADMNIAYAEHSILPSGFPLKWLDTATSLEIGNPTATFSDGTSAATAPKAIFYGGWYNYNNYNNVYQWLPGSFATDLNSGSYFGIQALDHGASAASYVVSEPFLDGAVRPNILYYYLLNGYTFAEASALATPYIGWMVVNEGDPLYAPLQAKTPVIDTQGPVLSAGYPTLAVNPSTGNAVMSLMVNGTPNPEVVTAQVQYGPDTNYGNVAISTGNGPLVEATGVFSRTPTVSLPWALGTVYHYRIVLTDPAGNITTTGDYTNTPSVSITTPGNGATVTGTVGVSANATDNSGVTGVQFTLDGANLGGVVTGAGPTYRYSWNSTATTNGSHTLTAVASDAAGNTASSSVTVTVSNTTPPPVVSLTAPANGATVNGTVTVTANATDSVGVTGVQFQLDGANLGSVVTGAGPTYSYSLSTTTVANGTHTLTATASDAAGNTASSSVSITVNNVAVPPVISGVAAGAVTSSGATITWTTDQASNSQVAYGTTSSYGSLSALNATLATSHSVTLTGLAASTTYHYQVLSQNAQGTLASSADYTFTTPAGLQTLLQIQGNATEVSGVTNGSVVTPNVTPGGFTGTVVDNGGSVNFTQSGNGVYFLNCCSNSGNAYYKFTGTTIGNIFNLSQGQVTFNLQSRYSFAQRQASAAASRYALDVRDGNGTHLFDFITQVTSGRLVFTYAAAGAGTYYFVPQGTEDTLFGNGVTMPVTLSWNGTTSNLYLNGTLVKSVSYATPTASWTVASNFDLGAYEYLTYGGYNVSDDVINDFAVVGVAGLTVQSPTGAGQVGTGYTSSLMAAGGTQPYTFSITSGTLPNGLTFTANTGAITGTPTTAGTFSFTATVTDSTTGTPLSTSTNCSITIAPASLTLQAPTGSGQVGTAYSSSLVAAGGTQPYKFSISSGTLPTGLTLTASTGAITGTPTTPGTFSFTATVTDSTTGTPLSTSSNCSITIAPASLTLQAPTGSGQVGTAYSSSLVAAGGTQPYKFSITSGTLPTGLTLTASTGAITGTPTTAGTFSFTATVIDSTPGTPLSTSSNCSITIAAASQTLLQIQGNATEVSGVTNGSVVTPTVTQAGFTGTVVVNGTGSANFTPAQSGNGVYFLNCCSNSGNAYYKFTGTTIGNIFNLSQGQVTFNLQSRYSFAQRQANAAAYRYAFDAHDASNTHLFNFLTEATGGYLSFGYTVAGTTTYYYVPKGTEDTLYGNGVILQVQITWNGTTANLYFNGTLVKSASYTVPTPNWTSASVFDLGAYDYFTSGYNVSDDAINEFTVTGPAMPLDAATPGSR